MMDISLIKVLFLLRNTLVDSLKKKDYFFISEIGCYNHRPFADNVTKNVINQILSYSALAKNHANS